MSEFTQSELLKAVSHLAMVADVVEVSPNRARAKVSFGPEAESAWLPWLTERASGISVWAPPSAGEQVLCLSPSGQTKDAIILGALFSGKNAAPSQTSDEHLLKIGGSSISVTGDRIIFTSNGSTIELSAAGIKADGARIDLN
jgi:phage baseplate assembly protein V